MAKRKKRRKGSRRARRGGGSQRAKFKSASAACRREVGSSGVQAFSPKSWSMFGSCMKKKL
jgi:hypothetical protein